MGFRIFEYPPSAYRVFRSSAPVLTLNLGYDAYVYTGAAPATWIIPRVSSRFSYVKVINQGSANLTVQTLGGVNEIWQGAPSNSLLIFPAVSWTLINDKTYWNVTT